MDIRYDNGDEEECRWPDKDMRVVNPLALTEEENWDESEEEQEDSVESGSVEAKKVQKVEKKPKEPKVKAKRKIRTYDFEDDDPLRTFVCDVEDCTYRAKRLDHLRTHKLMIHTTDAIYFNCAVEGCDYKAKQKGNLNRHSVKRHGLEMSFDCEAEGCDFKAANGIALKAHRKFVHNNKERKRKSSEEIALEAFVAEGGCKACAGVHRAHKYNEKCKFLSLGVKRDSTVTGNDSGSESGGESVSGIVNVSGGGSGSEEDEGEEGEEDSGIGDSLPLASQGIL